MKMNKEKNKENLHPLQFIWLWFGVKILKWKYIDIYSPNEDVIAMTFSMSEKYIDKVGKIKGVKGWEGMICKVCKKNKPFQSSRICVYCQKLLNKKK